MFSAQDCSTADDLQNNNLEQDLQSDALQVPNPLTQSQVSEQEPLRIPETATSQTTATAVAKDSEDEQDFPTQGDPIFSSPDSPEPRLPSEVPGPIILPESNIWKCKSLLTCDGGGIRGYASLLMLAELMSHIGRIERDGHSEQHSSSFYPCPRPQNMRTRGSGIEEDGAHISEYLPCHYFDYMIGTSTGGLIAIMLCRWRMSIAEALRQYRAVGRVVFGAPRPMSFVGIPYDKYHKAPLVKVIKYLTTERTPKVWQGDGDQFGLFPLPNDLSRCAVVANEETVNRTHRGVHLFRSYKIDLPATAELHDQPRHWQTIDNHEIWEVARATTAAPTFFRPQRIGDMLYSDGGVGSNNPTWLAIEEIDKLHRGCLKYVASFGTGKPVAISDKKKRLKLVKVINFASSLLKTARASLTDCEKTHDSVLQLARFGRGQRDAAFQYFRFNVEEGIGNVPLDAWTEGRDSRNPGQMYTTLDMLREHTETELQKDSVRTNMENLARQLVQQRRERAKDDPEVGRWERFACCTWYKCTADNCGDVAVSSTSFNLRGEMREHLRTSHSIPAYQRMTAQEVAEHMKTRLDQCRQLPQFPGGPY